MKKIFTIIFISILTISVGSAQEKRIDKHDFRAGVGLFYNIGSQAGGSGVGTSMQDGVSIYANYNYRFGKVWKASATIAYHNETTAHLKNTTLRFSPGITLEWLNRGMFTLYSEAGITYKINSVSYDRGDRHISDTHYKIVPYIVPFGITFGKKIYVGAELLSSGPKGVFNFGVGYRF